MIHLTKRIISQALDCGIHGTVIVEAHEPGWPVVYVNPAVEALLDTDASELIGRRLTDLVANGDLPAAVESNGRTEIPAVSARLKQSWRLRSGDTIALEFQLSPLYDRPGQPAYWLLSQTYTVVEPGRVHDDTQALRAALQDARLRLQKLETWDAATGIPNHKAFLNVLQRDWSLARREDRRVSLLIFQVDAFDKYREIFGRHAADSCLRKVAHAISGSLHRAGDFAARYDDDRFAVLVNGATENQVTEFAERIARKVRSLSIHHPRSPVDRFVTVTCGVASEVPAWKSPCSTLQDQAEAALDESLEVAADRRAG